MTEKIFAVSGTMIAAYLLGSISFGLIFARIFANTDVRDLGSGNTGMTNVLRTVGPFAGFLTGVGDFAKGAGAVLIGAWMFGLAGLNQEVGKYIAALAVLVGHLFPIFFRFRGGKGVMTSGAVVVMLNPVVGISMFFVFLILFLCIRIMSLTVLICFTIIPVFNFVLAYINQTEMWWSTIAMAVMTALLYITLHDNIKRLRAGTEKKLVVKLPARFSGKKQKQETSDEPESEI